MFSDLFSAGGWQTVFDGLKFFWSVAPVWAPILLVWMFVVLWLRYIRLDYIRSRPFELLEIKLPPEVHKSPAAMEIVLTALYLSSGAIKYKTFWQGEVRPWFSLELVSIGGDIHFFIWTDAKYSDLVTAQVYAQYPEAEVHTVPDYTNFVESDPEKLDAMWGTYFKQTKDDTEPIKTYIDYGLEKDPKPELAVNPLTATLEYLGNLRRGEQSWIQILVLAHKKEDWTGARTLFEKEEWSKRVQKKIDELVPDPEPPKDGGFAKFPFMKPGISDYVQVLQRHQSKYPFETAIRGMYIAEKGAFREINIVGLIGALKQYNYASGNGFKLGHYTDVGEGWKNLKSVFPFLEDHVEKKVDKMKKKFFEAYRLRSFFYPPYQHYEGSPYVLTTEELATIFHFPGGVAQTPTFKRIDSKKSEPPTNLPR